MYRGVGLIFFMLFFSACAYLDKPRWALLGDTNEQAFFIDSTEVQRLSNGNYRYSVKIFSYQKDQPHKQDNSHDTNQVLLIEMDCREKLWREAGRSVVDQNGRTLFRPLSLSPVACAIEPGTIHFAAYNYLCGDAAIIAQHKHQ